MFLPHFQLLLSRLKIPFYERTDQDQKEIINVLLTRSFFKKFLLHKSSLDPLADLKVIANSLEVMELYTPDPIFKDFSDDSENLYWILCGQVNTYKRRQITRESTFHHRKGSNAN